VTDSTIGGLIERIATAGPERVAIVAPGRAPLTRRALAQEVDAVGAAIRSYGVGRSDVVALVTRNGPEAAVAWLGIAAHAICAPLNAAYRRDELDFFLDDLAPKLVLVGADTPSPVRELAREREIPVVELDARLAAAGTLTLVPDARDHGATAPGVARPGDVALVLHTSGTTSRPKQVPLTHENLCVSAANVVTALDLGADDRCLGVMPLFHIHGLVAALLGPLASGGSVACTPGFRAGEVRAWIDELQPTWLTAVPTMLQALLGVMRADRNACSAVARLRFVRSSSAALPVPVAEAIEALAGVPVLEAYGMTEAAHQIASNRLPPARRVGGSVGRAAGPEIAILDEGGATLPVAAIGEIAIRGRNVFSAYVGNPDANAAAFSEGWFRTGDQGWLDAEGYLHLSGRLKEIINRGGEKIAPAEVDGVLHRHPAVATAVTFAIPDSRLGEEVGAAVVRLGAATVDERELQDFVAQSLAPFKVPRTIVFVDEIPRGPTGKLQRIGLHAALGVQPHAADLSAGETVPPRDFLERLVHDVWCELLGRASLSVHDDFFALGGDSLLGAEVIARVRDATGVEDLPLMSIVRSPTIAALAAEVTTMSVDRDGRALVQLALADTTGPAPLVLVHGVDGGIFGFPALARRLAGRRPLWVFQAPVDEHGRLAHPSLGALAEAYVAELRAAQPAGPYLIGGVCAGGPIAIEMARVLLETGEDVELLALVDPRVGVPRTLRFFGWRIRYLVWRIRSLAARDDATAALVRQARAIFSRSPRVGTQPEPVEQDLARLRDTHAVRPLAVRCVLLTSDDHAVLGTPTYVWKDALRDVQRVPFTGTHRSLFLPPTVDNLAAALGAVLPPVSE
jgi:acyl-CoA synthetase (AMP-forming)/AMP-acid ligase II/thioesterase domain-containing protein